MQDFTEERDYFFACLRLAKDKDFVVEKEKQMSQGRVIDIMIIAFLQLTVLQF